MFRKANLKDKYTQFLNRRPWRSKSDSVIIGGDLDDSNDSGRTNRWFIEWHHLLMLYIGVLLFVPVEFYKIKIGSPVDIQFDRIVFFMITTFWFVSLLIDRNTKLVLTKPGIALLVFAGIILVSFALNMQELTETARIGNAVKKLFYVSVMVALFFFVVSTITRREQIDKVFKFALSVAVVVSLFSALEFIAGFNIFRHLHSVLPFLMASPTKLGIVLFRSGHVRAFGSADHPIAFGVMLSFFLPLALHYYRFATSSNERLKYGAYMMTILLAMFMTISRTPFIAIIVMIIVYAFYKPRQAATFAAVLIAAVFVVHMAFPGVAGGLVSYFSPSYLDKYELNNPYGRVADQPKMIALFLEQPIYGRGYGWWDNQNMFYVDNQYLKIMVELGSLGLFGLLYLFLGWIKEIRHAAGKANPRDKDLLVAVLAACVAYMVTLATYDSFGFAQVTYLFFVIAGLGTSLARISLQTSKVTTAENTGVLYRLTDSSFTSHFGANFGSNERPLSPGVDPYGM